MFTSFSGPPGDVELPPGAGRGGQATPSPCGWSRPAPCHPHPRSLGSRAPAAAASQDGLFSPELNFPRLFDVTSCPGFPAAALPTPARERGARVPLRPPAAFLANFWHRRPGAPERVGERRRRGRGGPRPARGQRGQRAGRARHAERRLRVLKARGQQSRERVRVHAAPAPAPGLLHARTAAVAARHATGPEAPQPPLPRPDGHGTHSSTCIQRHFPPRERARERGGRPARTGTGKSGAAGWQLGAWLGRGPECSARGLEGGVGPTPDGCARPPEPPAPALSGGEAAPLSGPPSLPLPGEVQRAA